MASRWAIVGTAALALGLAAAVPGEAPQYTDCHNAYCVEPTWARADARSTVQHGDMDLTSTATWLAKRPPLGSDPATDFERLYAPPEARPTRTLDAPLTEPEWQAFRAARTQLAADTSAVLQRRATSARLRPLLFAASGLLVLVAAGGGLSRRRRLRQQVFRFERRTPLRWLQGLNLLLFTCLGAQILAFSTDLGPPPTPAACDTMACVDPSWGDLVDTRTIRHQGPAVTDHLLSVDWWVHNRPTVYFGGGPGQLDSAALDAFEAARPIALAAEQQRRVNWNRHRMASEWSRALLPYTGGLLLLSIIATLLTRRRRGRHVLTVRDHAVVIDRVVHDYDDLDVEDVRYALRHWADQGALGPYHEALEALVAAHGRSLAVRADQPSSDLSSLDVEAYIFDHPSHDSARLRATIVGRTTVVAFAVTAVLGVLVFTPVGETPFPFACKDAACVEPAWADIRYEDYFLSRRRALPVASPIDVQWWLDNRPPMDETDFGVHVKDSVYRADYDSFLAAREQLESHELWRRTRWSFLVRTAGYTRQAAVPAGLVAGLLFALWVVARRRVARTAPRQVTVGRHHVAIDGERIHYEGLFDSELRDALRELRNAGFEGNRTLIVRRAQQLAASSHELDRDPEAERRLRGLAART